MGHTASCDNIVVNKIIWRVPSGRRSLMDLYREEVKSEGSVQYFTILRCD